MTDNPSPLAALIAARRRSTAHRRFQQGQLIEEKNRWCARWREDVADPITGAVKRVRKWDVLAYKDQCPTKRGAMKLLDEKLRTINSEGYRPVAAEMFSSFADRWMASVMVQHAESSQREERRLIEKDLKPAFGSLLMRDITTELLQVWISGMTVGPKTISNRKTILSSMWSTAQDWGLVEHDPFKGLKLPQLEPGNVYVFSAEEMMAIIAEAKGWYKVFFELFSKTGMRPAEAAALRPEDIDGTTIHIRQTVWRGKIQSRVKTKRSKRNFTISAQLAEKLQAHIATTCPNKHGLIFLNNIGLPIKMDNFNEKVLRPILVRLGIWAKIEALGVRCGNYAFRHGNMTELHRAGTSLKTIQARVGHAEGSDVTMRHYIHAVSEDDRKAAEYMEALLSPKQEGEQVQ
jgi:integrase